MDLPEIVDVARNFAVMVRVQGPDPKGLKMRKHAFHRYNSGQTTLSASGVILPSSFCDAPIAKQINGNTDLQSRSSFGLIITVGSVIEPFLSLQHRDDISKLGKPELIPGVEIDVLAEGKVAARCDAKVSDKEVLQWLPAKVLALVDIPASSAAVQSLIETSSGLLENGWEVGWFLASSNCGSQPFLDHIRTQVEQSTTENKKQMVRRELTSPSLMGKATTRLAFLRVSSIRSENLPNLNMSTQNKKGDLLLAMGSPFGILSPVHFFNSISVGSISNCYPPGSSVRSLLMADIRCLPGMEGAAVLGADAQLIGILTRPLTQRTGGAEIQLVIPWEAIATACSDLLLKEAQNVFFYKDENLNSVGKKMFLSNSIAVGGSVTHLPKLPASHWSASSSTEKAMASVCLVTMDDGVWASGVLLNNQGLVLTNAHLLEPWRFGKAVARGKRNENKSDGRFILPDKSLYPGKGIVGGSGGSRLLLPKVQKTGDSPFNGVNHRENKINLMNTASRSIRVRLDHMDPWIWCDARVIYVSKGPLDVALLQLEFVPDQLCPIVVDFTCPLPGSKANVIGHGIFGPRCDISPSACVGVVAKVVRVKRPLPHSSYQEEHGQGHFPAMIETTAAVHPGGSGGAVVNMDGHMIGLVTSNAKHGGGTVIPHLNFSIPCAALDPIFKFSEDMQDTSLLEVLDKPDEQLSSVWALMPSLSPEHDPSLSHLQPLLPGENKKDTKGSRFAKFIAERQDLLKKTAQSGRVGGAPSKL